MTTRIVQALVVAGLALAAGCSDPAEFEPPRIARDTYTETGDFDAIVRRGQLRLLLVEQPGRSGPLPSPGTPLHDHLRAASEFARSLDLEPVAVPVVDFDALVPALREGQGDVIVTNRALPRMYGDVARTVALTRTRQVLVKRAVDPLSERADLAGRTITVAPRSPFWETARRLQDAHPALAIEPRSKLTAERKLELLAGGDIELTILNRNRLEAALEKTDAVASAFTVSEEQGVALWLRPDARRLKVELDRYIRQRALTELGPDPRMGDLDAIRERGTLRVATRNDAAHYFIWRGRLMGFEYELAKRFAEHLDVSLEVVVGADDAALRDLVRQGHADFAAAFLMRGSGSDRGLAYSRPYHHAAHQLVTDADDHSLRSLNDLPGRTLHVRTGSDAWRIARGLRGEAGLDVRIEELPASEGVPRVLSGVASGRYDLTIADDHIVANARAWNDHVRPALNIGREVANRWAFRASNPELLAAANDFLDEIYRSEFYNVIYSKYFDDAERIRRYREQRMELYGGQLTPYDDLLRKYAEEYGFDWRLLAAQAHEESSFDPAVRSWAGAVGLMQLLPSTARQIGVDGDLEDPETNLRAGVRYLDWLRNRFEEDLSVRDRTWFVLAAYNAGVSHVRDARDLAERLDLDPDRWFGHVEQAMLKLSDPEYFRDAPFGYVRGEEPVEYVRDIRARYQAYKLWTKDCWPDCRPDSSSEVTADTTTGDDASQQDAPATDAH